MKSPPWGPSFRSLPDLIPLSEVSIFTCHLCFTNIPLEQNYRIYVHEDASWNMKGHFKDALEDDDEVSWVTDNGQLTLAVCAEGKDSFAVPSTSHLPVSKAIGQQGDLSKNELIAL